MSRASRRFEILLPKQFNNGEAVPESLVGQTLIELEQQFRAASCETQIIQGRWSFGGQSFRDDLIRIFVDVDDLPENRQFFVEFKERLKVRFDQLDIWIVAHSIDII